MLNWPQMWFTDVWVVSIYWIPAAQHALNSWIHLIREANSSPAALWRHTAERAPVSGLATGFLCVREPQWIELLTNLSTCSGNIQQLHGTFHLQWMQFNDKQDENKSQTVLCHQMCQISGWWDIKDPLLTDCSWYNFRFYTHTHTHKKHSWMVVWNSQWHQHSWILDGLVLILFSKTAFHL